MFEGVRFTSIDVRKPYGEKREITIGLIQSITIVVAFTRRKRKTRIISARIANKKERRMFYEYLKKKN